MAGDARTIVVDVCHPAHAHFFRHPIGLWRAAGHRVVVAHRDKEVAKRLLDAHGVESFELCRIRPGIVGRITELVERDVRLAKLLRDVSADVVTAIGGIFAAHAGRLAGVPSVVFYDTEIATAQNALTYPLATRVVVPRCYRGWTPARRTVRYAGYHETSYLHPARFTADRDVALRAGLDPQRPTFLLRVVAWDANHDVGDHGIAFDTLETVVHRFEAVGKVLISSERPLPPKVADRRYQGDPAALHDVMAYCAGFFGESATMASECAMLGVPAVYAARSWRGYTDEQEARHGIVKNIRRLDAASLLEGVDWLLRQTGTDRAAARERIVSDCVDVAAFAAELVHAHSKVR